MTLIPSQIRRPLQAISSIVWLFLHTVGEMSERMARGRAPFRSSIFFLQTDRAGVGSIPLVALVSFFLGVTIALLTGYQLQAYGTTNLVPAMVAVGFTRELGPLLTGIMIASRVGAAFTAELGTMTVGEEVEAIETMGVGPFRFLVAPRLLAVFLLMPCLVVISDCAGIFGAGMVCHWQFSINTLYFIDLVRHSLYSRDIIASVLKSLVFGLLIGLISCYKGLSVRGGAAGVGDATTSSVVSAITTVIAADMLFNMILVNFYG